MSNRPEIKRLSDLHPGDNAVRISARSALDLNASLVEACMTCPKPVWFTAYFDGTGNNYARDGNGSAEAVEVRYSNIAKLALFAGPPLGSLPRVRTEYIEGVGTPCAKVGDSGTGLDSALGMAAAAKGELRIRWMLKQFEDHVTRFMPFISQINLAVFGFSRGATQARAFIRMLTERLAYEQGSEIVWCKPGLNYKQPKVVVYFVGLFDTVSSTGFGGSRLEAVAPLAAVGLGMMLPGGLALGIQAGGTLRAIDKGGHAEWAQDLRIPSYVKRCIHYIAAHEVREKFPSDSVREDQVLPGNCVEVCYPGMHSDVGGGYAFRTQEERSNELSRVPLNNMFIEAWRAGVPLKPPAEVMSTAGSLFEISTDLESAWNAYMGATGKEGLPQPTSADKLEGQIIWHMNRYYQWRASRRRRLRDGRLKPVGGVDPFLQITDRQWEEDIVNVAKWRTGWIQHFVSAHEEAMFDAFTGKWMASLPPLVRQSFDQFFDHYVHDSIAGFKRQMTEAHMGVTERSRWSENRRIFMGKRDGKYLFWRYEGLLPEHAGTQTALTDDRKLPEESDSLLRTGVSALA